MKKLVCSLSAAAILLSGMVAGAAYNVNATLTPDVNVNIDGTNRIFYNAQGQEVFPIIYNGSTYLPLRAIGEIMNKNVNWDANTKTATIGGNRVTGTTTGMPNNSATRTNIIMLACPEYTIVVDGSTRTFNDVNGNIVQPMNYNGSIYLPLRAIGEIMGKTVTWDAKTQTATLTGNNQSSGEVTDSDTQNPTKPTNPSTQNITLDKAKEIALNHAGKTASQVQFIKAYQGWDDGVQKYDIEFTFVSNSIIHKYDYEISMTGKILDYDYEAKQYSSSANVAISEQQAKQTALNKVSGAVADNIREFKLDKDDGKYKYEGKIVYGNYEYEFEIDANTGNIIEWDVDSIYD